MSMKVTPYHARFHMMRCVLSACLLLCASGAFAGDQATVDRTYDVPPVTKVDFEDGLKLEGKTVRPAIRLINPVTREPFESLVRPRLDFKPEMNASVELIK